MHAMPEHIDPDMTAEAIAEDIVATVTGFRLVFDSRVIAAAAAVGVAAGIAVLALPGIGGSVLVADDPVGWIWAVAPVLLSVTVVAWPRRRIESP